MQLGGGSTSSVSTSGFLVSGLSIPSVLDFGGQHPLVPWINQLEQEVVETETILGCKGSQKCREARLRRVTQELDYAKETWLDSVTARICSLVVQEDPEPWEEWQQDSPTIMLQPRTLTMQEVYADLQSWIPPMAEEIQALTETHGAVEIVTTEEVTKLAEEGWVIETIPSKLVPVLKPPEGKKRARIVGCGNYLDLNGKGEDKSTSLSSPVTAKAYDRKNLYANGLDSDALRIMLRFAAGQPNWTAMCTDVKTAFLLAPARQKGEAKRKVVLVPPKAVVRAGLLQEWERLLVQKALYGLAESPADWASFRDSVLRTFRWRNRAGKLLMLFQLRSEQSIWLVLEVQEDGEASGEGPIIAVIGLYVDDILLCGPEAELWDLYQALTAVWQMATPTWLTDGIRFCGLQVVKATDGSWLLHQTDYLEELVQRYQVIGSEDLPTYKEGYESLAQYSVPELRAAQKLVGELLWLSGRTRMDVSFHVSKLGHYTTKFPAQVARDSLKVLAYLAGTSHLRLRYGRFDEPWIGEQTLRFSRTSSVVESWSDASFAQSDERSHSGIALVLAGGLVSWHSSKQSLVSLSTAESEMISAVESLTMARALAPIWNELVRVNLNWVLYLDNLACTHLVVLPGGAWRTRHLRLRAHHFREAIEAGSLAIHHLPGVEMLSDVLTKPMTWTKAWGLLSLAGYVCAETHGQSQSHVSVEQVIRALTLLCVASQATAAAGQDLDEGEDNPWIISRSEWLVVGFVVLCWECLRRVLRRFWCWCYRVASPPKETQIEVGAGQLIATLKESYQGTSLGEPGERA